MRPSLFTVIFSTILGGLICSFPSVARPPAASDGPQPVKLAAAGAVVNLATVPDPLVSLEGQTISSAAAWESSRRPEILELFRHNVYGRAPVGRPENLRFEITDRQAGLMDGLATRKLVTVSYGGSGGQGTIHLVLFIPTKGRKPAPCFLLICNRGPENMDPTRNVKSPFWPAEQIVERGYAAAVFANGEVAPDKNVPFTNGVFGVYEKPGDRRPDSWADIAAWAWGASLVMDYLETDPDIDGKRVAVVGHSRGGKTALWAGAQDERFAMVVSNDSGCTGAALARGKHGERIQDINRQFPYWFCDNYKRFNGREEDLPLDQHWLLALVAPRLLYVASASEDAWSDPNNEFRAAVLAGPVYGLFGLQGLATATMPKPESPLLEGHIGYHLRSGKHDLTLYDWNRFMDFADRHLLPPNGG